MTTSPIFALGIKIIGQTAIAAILFSANIALGTTQLAMIGQQYFADGTGIAYFNDGTKEPFSHTLTADEGYYYDESTPFYLDTIPEVGNNTGSVVCGDIEALEEARQAAATNSSRTMPPSTNDNSGILGGGNITTITIIRGASLLSDKSRAVDPNPIVHIKVNDTLTWLNQDTTSHWLTSPPMSFGSNLPSATFINTFISSKGGTYSCTFTEAGGYHYTLGNDIKGAVIVEGNGSTPTEQVQQPASTSSLFSQQLQSQQEQESAQQSQSQQSQNQGGSVSIIPGSSSLTTDAYVPNPIQVSVGGTVTWTNDDSQPHTATSGENATPDQRFDSGIMAPAATFEHTFTEAGEYPYFCLLHPNMVGIVSVTDGSGSSSDITPSASNTATSTDTINTLTILAGSSIQGSPDYDPDELTVAAGSDVTVVNQDTLPHTVTSGTGPTDPNSAQSFDTSLIIGGESATLSLAQVAAGQYDYYCLVHPYMTGALTIVPAKLTDQTGETAASRLDDMPEPIIPTIQPPPSERPQVANTSALVSQSQQLLLEEHRSHAGTAAIVSIPTGSSTLTTDAYSPNPVQVSTGATVTWTNDDSQPHTATSGENATPDQRFDSGIMAPAATFEHTFTAAGEYPYFCLLHPNMVGIVSVTDGSGNPATTSSANNTTSTAASSAIANNSNTSGPLSGITDPLQDLFGDGDQTTGGSGSGTTNTGSSTFSSSPPPSSSSGSSSRCPDGYHRSPSGDCERVTDTRGMPRCPDGYHRSPSGNCEYVG